MKMTFVLTATSENDLSLHAFAEAFGASARLAVETLRARVPDLAIDEIRYVVHADGTLPPPVSDAPLTSH